MADTFSEAKAIIVDLLGADESKITLSSRFREDLEADSLDLVELLMAFEDKFGGEISDEDAQRITTVGDAVAFIDRQLGRVSLPSLVKTSFRSTQTTAVRPIPQFQVKKKPDGVFRPTKGSVFISYSRSDWNTYVSPLINRLRGQGISIWVDQHLIEGGQDWMDEINYALEICNRMILCVTPRSLPSKYVKMEYRYFINNNKLLIPLLCEQTKLPAELQGIQYTSYNDFSNLLRLL